MNIRNLRSLSLNLGNHTTAPLVSVGVSIDHQPFMTVNISNGLNDIALPPKLQNSGSEEVSALVRINAEGWQDNRINLESIILNPVSVPFLQLSIRLITLSFQGADLLPYTPSKLAFQFIGDSLSAVRGFSLSAQGLYVQ